MARRLVTVALAVVLGLVPAASAAESYFGFDLDLLANAVERALQRDRDRLAELEAEFAPIQDKAVPERMLLRPKLDGYRAAVRDLEAELRSW
jgi:hypothetical protein